MEFYFILFREIGHFILFVLITTGLLPLGMTAYVAYKVITQWVKIEEFIIKKFPYFNNNLMILTLFAVMLPVLAVLAVQSIIHVIEFIK